MTVDQLQLRRQSREAAIAQLVAAIDAAAKPGFYGRVELLIQDGFVDLLRVEQTKKIPRPTAS